MQHVEMGAVGNNGERQYLNRYLPLYKAAKEGDWQKAEIFISDVGRDAVIARITVSSDTALHIAATEGHSEFVEKLVILMTQEQLEITNDAGETALQMAVFVGNIESIKAMVEKNKRLTQIPDAHGGIPLVNTAYFASQNAKKDIIEYLSPFLGDLGRRIICSVIGAGFYDVARDMINTYPNLAFERHESGPCALEMMATRPTAFLIESRLSLWDHFICSLPGIDIGNKKLRNEEAAGLVRCIFDIMSRTMTSSQIKKYFKDTNILQIAIKTGALELLMECLQTFPGLMWIPLGEEGLNIFSIAILRRQENIFNLVYHINGFQKKMANTLDNKGNNLLHLAAQCNFSRQTNQGPCIALQIQRELQWFQEVESLLPLHLGTANNLDKSTPREVFRLEHQKAIADAEK